MNLIHDHFQNYKRYNIPKAQLVIADIPYNVEINAYASNPQWYKNGDMENGQSKLAGKQFIGNCELYLGDSLEILPLLDLVDAVVTDPPYGVMLGELNTGQGRKKGQVKYDGFSDTPEYIKEKVIPIIELSIAMSKCALITPGSRNLLLYPQYDDIGVWFNPAGSGVGRWGFILAHMILYYGKNPKATKPGNGASSAWLKQERIGDINNIHPCPKPLNFMKWAVNKVSFENQIILDPFMGSGTTGVACIDLNRKFIGIEINETYFNAACKRIELAAAQGNFDFGETLESTPPLLEGL